MFSPSLKVVFSFCLWVSSAVQKLLSLISSHLFTFVFISITLGDRSKKKVAAVSVLPVFSSENFIVSGLTFSSLIHVEFIFVCGVVECSNSILYHVAVQLAFSVID